MASHGHQGDGDALSSSRSASLPTPRPPTTSIDISNNNSNPHHRAAATSSSSPDVALTATSSLPTRPIPPTFQLRRSSSGGHNARLVRRVTTQERLDGILEVGHQRHMSMSHGQSPPAFRSPFRNVGSGPTSPPMIGGFFNESDESPRRPDQVAGGGGGGGGQIPEPDETTGIVRKGPRNNSAPSAMNYQSITPSDPNVTRSRKTGTTRQGTSNGNGHERNGHDAGDDYEQDKEANTWWKQQLAKFGSIELENKGSVARDHLALERTFLAWLRTSLSFASIGVAITQLFRLNTSLADAEGTASNPSVQSLRHLGKPLGGVFLGISILILFLGYHRYFQAQQWIIKGKFPASRGTVILVSLVALGLMVVSLVVVLLVNPNSR